VQGKSIKEGKMIAMISAALVAGAFLVLYYLLDQISAFTGLTDLQNITTTTVVLLLFAFLIKKPRRLKKRRKRLKKEARKNISNSPSTPTREDFDRILIEEGVLSEKNRDEVWRGRPEDWNEAGDEATEYGLRKTAKAYLKRYPDSAKEDLPASDSG